MYFSLVWVASIIRHTTDLVTAFQEKKEVSAKTTVHKTNLCFRNIQSAESVLESSKSVIEYNTSMITKTN